MISSLTYYSLPEVLMQQKYTTKTLYKRRTVKDARIEVFQSLLVESYLDTNRCINRT